MNAETKELLALGDTDAWNKFYNKYEAHIKKIVTNRVSDKNYIKDLCSEIFEIIYKAMHRFDIKYPEENWISKISVFHCINHHRIQKSKTKTYSNFNYIDINNVFIVETNTCEDDFIKKENYNILKKSFEGFSYIEKKILIYRIFKEFKYSEIEEKLLVHPSTIKNTIRKHKRIFKYYYN